MSANDSTGLKAGVTDGGEQQCKQNDQRHRIAERARQHTAQAITRAEEEPAQAREHLRETLSLLDALEEAL